MSQTFLNLPPSYISDLVFSCDYNKACKMWDDTSDNCDKSGDSKNWHRAPSRWRAKTRELDWTHPATLYGVNEHIKRFFPQGAFKVSELPQKTYWLTLYLDLIRYFDLRHQNSPVFQKHTHYRIMWNSTYAHCIIFLECFLNLNMFELLL